MQYTPYLYSGRINKFEVLFQFRYHGEIEQIGLARGVNFSCISSVNILSVLYTQALFSVFIQFMGVRYL